MFDTFISNHVSDQSFKYALLRISPNTALSWFWKNMRAMANHHSLEVKNFYNKNL